MVREVDAAMDAGAIGLSSGLIYAPGHPRATRRARGAGRRPRRGTAGCTRPTCATRPPGCSRRSTRRSRRSAAAGDGARAPGLAPQVRRARGVGPGRARRSSVLERARAEGLDVAADQYPYTAAATTLATILPPALLALGVDACVAALARPRGARAGQAEIERGISGWEDIARDPGWGAIRISYAASHPDWSGRTLAELGDVLGREPADVAFEALMDDRLDVSIVIDCMSEPDVETIMAVPWIAVCTDAEGRRPGHPILDAGKPHPRTYGSTARVLGTYVARPRDRAARDRGRQAHVRAGRARRPARPGRRPRGRRRRPRRLRPGDRSWTRRPTSSRPATQRHGPRHRQRRGWPSRTAWRPASGPAGCCADEARERPRPSPRPSRTSPAARSTTRSAARRGRAPCGSSSTRTAAWS